MNIYADHAATTAMSKAAIEAMTRCVILDALYMAQGYWKVSNIDEKWLKI